MVDEKNQEISNLKNLKLLLKEYKYQEKKKSKLRRISLVSALTVALGKLVFSLSNDFL